MMDRELYERTELEIINFNYDYVITTSFEEDELSSKMD